MSQYGVYVGPFKIANQPGKFLGSNTGGSIGASEASGQGIGKSRIYYIQDANGLHVGTCGPFTCDPADVATAKTSFESALALMAAAV